MNAERINRLLVLLLVLLVHNPAAADKSVQIVLDASNSMWGQVEGRHKIDIAKSAMADLVKRLDGEAVNAGLVVYGHRAAKDCDDIEQMVEPRPLEADAFLDAVGRVSPKGMTPIASALELAASRWSQASGEKEMILLTDGIETCGREPGRVISELRARQEFRLHVVGFDVSRPEHARSLRELADAGGGGYYTAASVEELHAAFSSAARTIETGAVPEPVAKVQMNVGIILDRSQGMGEPYEERTRLALARAALDRILERQIADRDNLAYRHFGGRCEGQGSELVVPFGLNNAPRIREAIKDVDTRGRRTLIDAVVAAAQDVQRQVPYADVDKRVVILTGGMDACDRSLGFQYINRMLENRDVLPHYEFIGIGMHASDAAELDRLARAVGGETHYVTSEDQLDDVLRWIFEVRPVQERLNGMVKSINDTVNTMNAAMRRLNEGRVVEARQDAEAARELASETFTAYRDLARRQGTEKYVAVFRTATKLREMQRGLVDATAALISYRAGYDAYVGANKERNALLDSYNQSVSEVNALMRTLREE